jgi:hypothetical protein
MTPEFHGRLAAWVEKNIADNDNKMMVLAPRVVYKTSLLTIAMTLWLVINNPEVRILIVQASAEKVKEVMNAIKGTIKSWAFTHYFPELVPQKDDRFSEKAIELPRVGIYPEPTISARGVDSVITGGHYSVHLFDDVVDETAAWSEVDMERVVRWFRNSSPLFVNREKGIRIVVGTRWAMQDLYQHIIDSGNHRTWIVGPYLDDDARKLGFSGDDGALLFPEGLGNRTIEGYREEMGDVFFSYQILNRPVPEGLLRFHQEGIKYYNWRTYREVLVAEEEDFAVNPMFLSMCVDPAIGKTAESDYFAITVCGWDRIKAKAFCFDFYEGRLDPRLQAMKIIEMHKKWKPNKTGIESVGYQFGLAAFVKEFMRQEEYFFWIEPLKPKQGAGKNKKSERIEGLQPFVMNGQMYFSRQHGPIIKQLLGFQPRPDGSTGLKHDDLIDSLAYHVPYWSGKPISHKPDYIDDDELEDWTTRDRGKTVAEYGLEN